MKVAEIALVFLIFNIVMGLITYSGLSSGSIYYEKGYIDRYSPSGNEFPQNLSATSEDVQYSQTMDMIGVMFGSLTFNWLFEYVPQVMKPEPIVTGFITGLNAILIFLYSCAIIELFIRQTKVIG